MNRLRLVLEAAVRDLSREKVSFALVGGIAVSVRTEPRFTRHVDLAVAVSGGAEAESLVRALIGRGWGVVAQLEEDQAERLATVRLSPPDAAETPIVVDLLFASSGLEREIVSRAEELEVFEGFRVPVATASDLLAMKILAMDEGARMQDAMDASKLLAGLDADARAGVRELLTTLSSRGFDRGKDLLADYEALLRRSGG